MQKRNGDDLMPNMQTIYNQTTPLKWKYQLFGSWYFQTDNEPYFSYGIQIYQQTQENKEILLLLEVPDISIKAEFVENMARQFTLNQLSPIHIYDAIIDMLP